MLLFSALCWSALVRCPALCCRYVQGGTLARAPPRVVAAARGDADRAGSVDARTVQLLTAGDVAVGDWGGGRLRVRYHRKAQRLQLLLWPNDGKADVLVCVSLGPLCSLYRADCTVWMTEGNGGGNAKRVSLPIRHSVSQVARGISTFYFCLLLFICAVVE